MLGSVASRNLGEGPVEILSDKGEELNIEDLPLPGEFVAFVAASSTKSIPEVLVAKVLRLSDDKKSLSRGVFSVRIGKIQA